MYASAESLLMHVGDHIHEEVKVLYPDARPPKVRSYVKDGTLHVEYASHRPFANIARGLITGAMKHFGDDRKLEWKEVSEDGRNAEFVLI